MMQQLRFGLIGWGYWGPKLARNLESLPQASLEIVADLNPLSLAKVKAERPWIKTTMDVNEIFDSQIDGVAIATPVITHYELARKALMRGKHVLVEKPLTASVAHAQDLIDIAASEGRILMAGHTFTY